MSLYPVSLDYFILNDKNEKPNTIRGEKECSNLADHFGLAMAENIDGTQSTQQAESIIIFIVRAKMCLRALDVQIESLQSI